MIGIKFIRPSFLLASVEGRLIEMLADLGDNEKGLGERFFEAASEGSETNGGVIQLSKLDNSNRLTISKTDIVFRKTQFANEVVRVDKVIEEFKIILKEIFKILKIKKGFRRIGLVVEYRQQESTKHSAANEFRDSLINIKDMGDSRSFQLKYEDREVPALLENHNPQIDPFENCIYTYYLSENDDQTKEDGKLCFSLDSQRYFNPSIPMESVYRELDTSKKAYIKKKKAFLQEMKKKGFLNND